MDGHRFDRLVKGVATRRQIGRGLFGTALAILTGARHVDADDEPRLVELAPPSTGPKLGGIGVEAITPTSAVVVWTTSEPADGTVEYGPTPDLGQAVADAALVTDHRVALTDLTPATAYHYRVRSRNANGTHATHADRTFTTAPDVLAVSPESIAKLAIDALIGGDFDAFARTFAPGTAPAIWSDFWQGGTHSQSIGDLAGCAGVSYGLGSWAGEGCRPSVHSTDVEVIAFFAPPCGQIGDNVVSTITISTHRIGDGWYLAGLFGVNGNPPEFGPPCVDAGDPTSGGVCAADRVNCHDICVDITIDSDHCGGCDMPCRSDPGAQDANGCQCARSTAGDAACIHILMGGCADSPACSGDADCGDGARCVSFDWCPTGVCARTCVPSPAGSALPDIYLGSLAGTGTQTNPPESWPITMFFTGGLIGETVGSDDYPTLGCRASLTLERVDGDGSIVLTEHITEGLGVCVDGGTFVLSPRTDGSFAFTWTSPNGGSTAEGTVDHG
jgi:hypothetical protein